MKDDKRVGRRRCIVCNEIAEGAHFPRGRETLSKGHISVEVLDDE